MNTNNFLELEIGTIPARGYLRVSKKILKGIDDFICKNELEHKFEVLNTSLIDLKDIKSQVLDIVIYERMIRENCDKPLVIIELSSKKHFRATCDRVITYFDISKKLKEAFVYDYELNRWRRFNRKGEFRKNASHLDFFNIDLAEFIEK